MSLEFAKSLIDMRLLQTARLLEWMRDNVEADVDSVATPLAAVVDAHRTIKGMSVTLEASTG